MARALRCTSKLRACQSTHIEVIQFKCSYSAFNGYRYMPSDSSAVRCIECGHVWRTKSNAVYHLPRSSRRI